MSCKCSVSAPRRRHDDSDGSRGPLGHFSGKQNAERPECILYVALSVARPVIPRCRLNGILSTGTSDDSTIPHHSLTQSNPTRFYFWGEETNIASPHAEDRILSDHAPPNPLALHFPSIASASVNIRSSISPPSARIPMRLSILSIYTYRNSSHSSSRSCARLQLFRGSP